jgi:hypothetical protein
MKKNLFSLCIMFALVSMSAYADDASLTVPNDLYAQGYGSSSSITGRYYSEDISMPDMPGGKGYWVLQLSSGSSFVLARCCSANGAVIDRYTGEYKYIFNNGEGAGSLWSNGNRIGTFITTSTGIRLGSIDMKKR